MMAAITESRDWEEMGFARAQPILRTEARMERGEVRDSLSVLQDPGLRFAPSRLRTPNEKGPVANRDRAFIFSQFEAAAQAAFDTSSSLSISSVPIR